MPWDIINGALGDAGSWVGNQLGGIVTSDNHWILYNGLKVITYQGSYGNIARSSKVNEYAGTSGGEGFQNSKNQNIPDVGPVPEGDYSINLKPDFTRKAKTNADGSTKPDIGVDLLPWGNGTLYSGWGQWRASLEKLKVKSTRENFYFHDSYKGYSHGCIETNTALYYDLARYKKGGQNFIKVKIIYSPGSSTNGGAKKFPPPWWNGKRIKYVDGIPYPEPVIGSFPKL